MTKVKLEGADEDSGGEMDQSTLPNVPAPSTDKEEYENLCQFVNAISQPMAPRKLAKKVYKLIKKSAKIKYHLRQGVVEVQRGLRKGEKGLVVLAGNVTPIDVSCHIPGVCEEKGISQQLI